MKIAILSRSPRSYSTRRLKEACIKRGHKANVLDTIKFAIYVEQEDPSLTFKGQELSHYDAVIPRIGASITLYGTAVVRQFEQMGTYTLNPSHGVSQDDLGLVSIFEIVLWLRLHHRSLPTHRPLASISPVVSDRDSRRAIDSCSILRRQSLSGVAGASISRMGP